MLTSLPVLWVNQPGRHADAGYKPVQMATAARCGLTVPDTLITNEASAVREFAARGPTVTKMLGAPAIVEEHGRKVTFTEIIRDEHLDDLQGIEVTTHQFQAWVAKAHEARVVVVGQEVFAVAIHAKSDAARIDWRMDYPALTYEVISPPAEVIAGVIDVMSALGLAYGAFDFVITPDRNWIFF